MIKGGIGGASTKTGLKFEERVELTTVLSGIEGYEVKNDFVYFNSKKVAQLVKKNKLYKEFLEPRGIDWNSINSKKLLPDEAIYIFDTAELHIIEMKYQETSGSVDEKLQTCDFKKKQYIKLLNSLNIKVHYTYVLNDWYKQDCYRDVLEYIKSVDCNYFFTEIPLDYIGLPVD